MRVLLLSGRLSDRGGADRWFLGVAAGLRARGLDVVVGVERVHPGLPAAEAARVGPVRRVRGLDRRGLRRAGAERAQRALGALLAEVRPDAVLANHLVDPGLLDKLAATGRALVVVQDHRATCPGPGRTLPDGRPCHQPPGAAACAACLPDPAYRARLLGLAAARAAALRRVRGVVVLSRYMAGDLRSAGVERVHVVPPFVDALPERPRGTPRHHLLAGRLDRHKGVEIALEAARLLRGPLPLVVAGDGPLRARVEAAAGERLRLVSWADRERLADLLAEAATAWLPSRWQEPFGIAGLEATWAGVPVLASHVGGVPEWLADGEGGLLLPPGDAPALARAADALAADPDGARRLGDRGRVRARARFSPARALDRLEALLRAAAR